MSGYGGGSGAGGRQSFQRIVYDGKRMRKAMVRRTIDYTSPVLRMFEVPMDAASRRISQLQPTPSHLIAMMPPMGLKHDPMNAVCTKFVHSSQNKARCPINVARWSPDGRRVMTGASTGEITLWNGTSFNFETILQVTR